MASTAENAATAAAGGDDHLARGIRALALKHWSDACDCLAQAVEHATSQHGDLAPENVEPLILYGKALLGSAIAQSAVLGGAAPAPAPEAAPEAQSTATGSAGPSSGAGAGAPAASTKDSKPNFHFGGDAEDDDEQDEEDGEGAGEGQGDEDGDGEGAPGGDREDDLESAFQVLDMARATLEKEIASLPAKQGDDGLMAKKERLAEVHRLLGDVATESEQFDSAVDEYTSALDLLSALYAPSNRALSELHMLIALALDFVPNGNDRAVSHAERAKKVLLLKLDELERVKEEDRDDKAKREIEDIKGLMGDVDMKIEDLRTVPVAPAPTASDSALEAFLRQSTAALRAGGEGGEPAPVNDLSSLVKKKKKAPEAAAAPVVGGGAEGEVKPEVKAEAAAEGNKRTAGDESEAGEGPAAAKKAKVEDSSDGRAEAASEAP
ncbi:hypothetical protein JCM8202_000367 [Rhodotorula sphaerocarpa]